MQARRARGHRGRPASNAKLREEIRRLQVRLEAMEVGRQRDPEGGDISDAEEELEEEGAAPVEEVVEINLLREVLGSSLRPKTEISIYDDSLKDDNLLDWISEMEKYFEYKEINEDKRVKFVVIRLKCHVALWWYNVQVERRKKDKPLIKSWDRMVVKMEIKFFPKDYQLTLYKNMKKFKQKIMTVRDYTEEFYKVNLRVGYVEDNPEKTMV